MTLQAPSRQDEVVPDGWERVTIDIPPRDYDVDEVTVTRECSQGEIRVRYQYALAEDGEEHDWLVVVAQIAVDKVSKTSRRLALVADRQRI